MASQMAVSPLQWVEQLLEPSANETMMIKAAQVFSRSHYSDVVEERCISDLCGYPMCGNPLGEQPRQKYHISVSQKKVFDLTERKKFCSAMCYRASKYYASQLSFLPLAARDGNSVAIKLMPYVGAHKLPSSTTQPDTKCQSTAPIPPEGTVPLVNIKEKDTTRLASKESLTVSEATSKMRDLELEDAEDTGGILNPPKLSSVGRLLHAMSSWCTPATWELLASITLTTQESRVLWDTTTATMDDRTDLKRDSTMSNDSNGQEAAPLRESTSEARSGGRKEDRGTSESGVLPLVHSSSKSQLQMGIFLQQLKRNFPSVATQLSLNHHEVFPRVLQLVRTFSVDPDWGLKTVHSASVCEWMKKMNATDGDLRLMLDTFKLPDHIQQSQ